MSINDVFSRKLRFSHRQVARRPFVLSSSLPDNTSTTVSGKETHGDKGTSRPKPKVTTQKNRHRYNDLNQSSPLVPLDETEENASPKHQSETKKILKNSMTKANVAGGKSKGNSKSPLKQQHAKNFQNSMEVLTPLPPVEVSYLASTPKPGKQQLRRERPFTATKEVNENVERSNSSKQSRSSSKVSQSSSSVILSSNSRESKKKPLPYYAESPNDSQSKKTNRKKINVSCSSRSSIESLTKAVAEKRLMKRKEKQNIVDNTAKHAKDSQLLAPKANKENTALIISGRLSKFSARKRQLSEDTNSDTNDIENADSSVIENETENLKNARLRLSAKKARSSIEQDTLNKENRKTTERTKILRQLCEKSVSKSVSVQKKSTKKKQAPDVNATVSNTNSSKHGARFSTIASSVKSDEHANRKTSVTSVRETLSKSSSARYKSQNQTSSESQVKSVRRKRRISSDSETDEQQEDTVQTKKKTLHREEGVNGVCSASETNGLSKKKQASGSVTKKRSMMNSIDNTVIGPDQTVMVWVSEDLKRKKTDVVDIDVVLNSFSEILESQVDLCESEIEQRAVRTLEKYLRQDITYMIRNVQNVNSLQKEVRKSTQEIKQKKIHLMSLQKQRLELEEKDAPRKEQRERNRNIQEINSFIQDLQELIDLC